MTLTGWLILMLGLSVDPYLSGILVAETVSAVQSVGVITSTKVRKFEHACGIGG